MLQVHEAGFRSVVLMLADLTIPSPSAPRSLHDQLTFSVPHFTSLGLPSSSPMLKRVNPRCLPSQPDPFGELPPDSAAAVAATSARPRSNTFIEVLRQGASKDIRESVRCLGVEAVTPLRVPNAVSWPIRYIFALTSGAVIRGLTLWHAEMNLRWRDHRAAYS